MPANYFLGPLIMVRRYKFGLEFNGINFQHVGLV